MLTLTCDEVSGCRWECVDHLEEFFKGQFQPNGTWQDIPAECAALFHARLTNFLTAHILPPEGGLLGKVKHYLRRYEVQGRGSLHAHILLWLESKEEAEMVGQEITASMPCTYTQDVTDPDNPVWRPNIPAADKSMVSRLCAKQKHTCDPRPPYGCSAKNRPRCERQFPFPDNREGTIFNPDTQRFEYFRFAAFDEFIAPYHPGVLLLWNAHMNLQRITASAWSYYVLKYCAKMEPTGNLSVDEGTAPALGLHGLSPHQAQLASAGVLCKPMSVAEAYLILAGVPIIECDEDVTFVDTTPPEKRRVSVRFGSGITIPAVDRYCNRPLPELAAVGYKAYFAEYEVRKRQRGGQSAVPRGADPDAAVLTDGFCDNVYKLSKPRLIRTTNHHPARDTQGFFYELLLDHQPFTCEADVLPADGNYFAGDPRGVFIALPIAATIMCPFHAAARQYLAATATAAAH
jgi:hypothetical protein